MEETKRGDITDLVNEDKRTVTISNSLWEEITQRKIALNSIVPTGFRQTQELAIMHGFCRYNMSGTCLNQKGICYDCQHLKAQVLKHVNIMQVKSND